MRGQILGFDGESGAITGDDGSRYSFSKEHWKGDGLPKARDTVDFVAEDGAAREVYLVQSAPGATPGGSGGAARDPGAAPGTGAGYAGAREFAATRPQVILEALVILVVLLFTFASGSGPNGTVTTLGFPDMMNQAANAFKQLGNIAAETGGMFGQPQVAPPQPAGLQFAAMLSYILYLIPLVAAFAIFRDATQKRMRVLELALGALCVGSFAVYYVGVKAISSAAGPMGSLMERGISFGFGGYLLVLCGILLILTGLGRISRTPGL